VGVPFRPGSLGKRSLGGSKAKGKSRDTTAGEAGSSPVIYRKFGPRIAKKGKPVQNGPKKHGYWKVG